MPFFLRPPPPRAGAPPYGSFHPGEGAAGRHDARFRTTCSLRKGFSSVMARVIRGTGLSWLLRSGALGMDFLPVGWLRSGNWDAVGEQGNPNTASSGSWPPVRQRETTRDPNGVGLSELPGGFPAGGSGSPASPHAGPSDNRKAGSIGGPEHGAIAPPNKRGRPGSLPVAVAANRWMLRSLRCNRPATSLTERIGPNNSTARAYLRWDWRSAAPGAPAAIHGPMPPPTHPNPKGPLGPGRTP